MSIDRDISRWKGEILKTQKLWKVTLNDENDYVLQGKRGVISVYPDGDLDVWVTNLRASRVIELQGWKAKNHYDDGAVFVRPYADLDKAAKFIKAKKRRYLSPEAKARAIKRLEQMRTTRPA